MGRMPTYSKCDTKDTTSVVICTNLPEISRSPYSPINMTFQTITSNILNLRMKILKFSETSLEVFKERLDMALRDVV